MRKLAFKIILLASILYVISYLYIDTFPMYYNSINNTRWYYFKQIFTKNITIDTSKILFLGDSRLNTNIDVKTITGAWSFAAGGSSPIEMYHALNNYVSDYLIPDTVFISFSPHSLIEVYSFWGYAIRNNYFRASEFYEIYNNSKKFRDDNVLGEYPFLKYLAYQANFINYYQSDIYLNHVLLAYSKNENVINQFQREKGIWNYPNLKEKCSELNYEAKLDSFAPSPLLNFYLIKLLAFCREKNICAIYENMPMNKSSYKMLKPQFIKDFKNYFSVVRNQFPEFYISDSLYYYEDIYFGDESHLNKKGKQQFTNYFLNKYFNSVAHSNN